MANKNKFLIGMLFLTILSSLSFANFAEVSGTLNYNFTYVNQSITKTWTLVNTGNTSLNVSIIIPSENKNFVIIGWAGDAIISKSNLTLAPKSYNNINVTIYLYNETNSNVLITAYTRASSNLNVGLSKELVINSKIPQSTNQKLQDPTQTQVPTQNQDPTQALNIQDIAIISSVVIVASAVAVLFIKQKAKK